MTEEEKDQELERFQGIIARNGARYRTLQAGAKAWRSEALQSRVTIARQLDVLRRSVPIPELGAPATELEN